MGFFSKIFKGVKKVFKKIGKGIKSAFKGIGKFMNKIGVVGQIAMMFLMPYLGPMVGGFLKGVGGMAANALTTYGGAVGQSIVNGAKFVITKGAEFAGAVKNTFRTVTDGVTSFASEFTKTGLNKMGFDPVKFGFKEGGSFNQWVQSGADQSFGDAWNKVSANVSENYGKILDPFKKSVEAGSTTTLESLSDSTYKPMSEIQEMNPNIRDWDNISGQTINLDPNNVAPIRGFTPISELAPTVTSPSLLESVPGGEEIWQQGSATPGMDLYDPRLTDPTHPEFIEGGSYGVHSDRTTSALTDATGNALADTGGKSLLSMPSLGDATTQVGVNVASQMAMDAIAGPPPVYSQGYVVDAGPTQVYGASQPYNYMQSVASQYMGYRDPEGSYGYNPAYANHMRLLGMA